jgi:hypothetical protein
VGQKHIAFAEVVDGNLGSDLLELLESFSSDFDFAYNRAR